MSFFDKFKKKFERGDEKKSKPAVGESKSASEPEVKKAKAQKKVDLKIRDKSGQAGRFILRPLQTEKITGQISLGQYTFEVSLGANKTEVKKSVKAMYGVDPVRVRMINIGGKTVRFGRIWSKRKNRKKAIVTLKPGEKIALFEGV